MVTKIVEKILRFYSIVLYYNRRSYGYSQQSVR